MLQRNKFAVYGGTGNHDLDAEVLGLVNSVTSLGLAFSHCWHNVWTDGEPGFSLEHPDKIAGRHVLVFACPVNHKLENEFKDLVTACRQQYGAASVVAVLSFLRYRRQDHPEFGHEITRLRWFICDLKHWGADRLVVCEPHSVEHTERYCKEFGLELHVSDPTRLFADAIMGVVQTLGGAERVRVYSPDFGSVGRALSLAKALGTSVLATPKRRMNGRIELVADEAFAAAVREKFGSDVPFSCDIRNLDGLHLFMREDEVASGSTAVGTARMLRKEGAGGIHLLATHPVCSRGWKMTLFPHGEEQPFDNIWLGNTRPRGDGETKYEGSTGSRVKHVDMAPATAKTLVKALERLAE